MTTLDEFIAAQGLSADVERTDANPNMADDNWSRTASHWLVMIKRGDQSMSVPFSQGLGHTQPPTLADVLDCIASDAATVDNSRSFDDWADELGFFPMDSSADYKRAQSAYESVIRQTAELRTLFDDPEVMESLMYEIERM